MIILFYYCPICSYEEKCYLNDKEKMKRCPKCNNQLIVVEKVKS